MRAPHPALALGVEELVAAYRARETTPQEMVELAAARIAEVDAELRAFLTLCIDRARHEAREWVRAMDAGEALPPLAGVPFAAKDVFDTEGVRTTYGAAMCAEHVPARDAAAVRLARAAGAVLVGKTSTHEFAWGITSANPHFGDVRNPWDPSRISGGSSGGSAAALAAFCVPLALGSDTGGSTRVPASFCGVAGLKPTYGRLAVDGLVPLAPSLDHVGAMGRSPADAAALFAVLDPAGGDAGAGGVEGLVVARCPDLDTVPLPEDRARALAAAADALAGLGARLVERRFPEAEAILPTFATVQSAEALAGHRAAGRYPARAAEYGADVRGRLRAAEAVTAVDYQRAIAARERLRAGFARLLAGADLLLTPVAACPPPPPGTERVAGPGGRERPLREAIMASTVPQDLLGLPACAVRAGFDDAGLPVGVQVTGRPWADALVLDAARALATATPEVQAARPDRRGPRPRRPGVSGRADGVDGVGVAHPAVVEQVDRPPGGRAARRRGLRPVHHLRVAGAAGGGRREPARHGDLARVAAGRDLPGGVPRGDRGAGRRAHRELGLGRARRELRGGHRRVRDLVRADRRCPELGLRDRAVGDLRRGPAGVEGRLHALVVLGVRLAAPDGPQVVEALVGPLHRGLRDALVDLQLRRRDREGTRGARLVGARAHAQHGADGDDHDARRNDPERRSHAHHLRVA
jgi:aspartyl-tRNA(Asn)/glutamyl-tRNA(Gln) amidotransferase subunit A